MGVPRLRAHRRAFLLIGIAIPLPTLGAAAVSIFWGVVAVLLGRAIVIYGLLGGAARLERRFGLDPLLPVAWLHVMNWTGLRGAVAAALALSIPVGTPDRELLQGNGVRRRVVHPPGAGHDRGERPALGRRPGRSCGERGGG